MRITFWICTLSVFLNLGLIIKPCIKKHNSTCFIPDVFMQLPIESIPTSRKIELLKTQRIDSIDDESYMTIEIDSLKNSIFVQSCPIGGTTMPCNNYHIRSYEIDSCRFMIVYSKSTNSFADNFQDDLRIYQYNTATHTLSKDTIRRKAFNIQLKDFFVSNAPQAIIDKYSENINPVYSFRDSVILCSITDRGYRNTLNNERFLKGNTMEILWNGIDFKVIRIYKED